MATEQQNEALEYFQAHADDWHQKAKTLSQVKFNVIQARNYYVLQIAKERDLTRNVLDVGCGTGDLVCDIARLGIPATGVDFAQDMIDHAVVNAADAGLKKADFVCASIFDFDFSKGPYDLISANGFIEYISLDELSAFFKTITQALSPGGSFVVGSRNRLFNLYSLNDYTRMEMDGPDLPALLDEAIALASGGSLGSLLDIKPAVLQEPDTQHARTNIGVTTRFQFTPVQLTQMLAEVGLETVEICPVHIHGIPPAFKADQPKVHTSIANLLQSYGRHRLDLLPSASTFMVHARKREV